MTLFLLTLLSPALVIGAYMKDLQRLPAHFMAIVLLSLPCTGFAQSYENLRPVGIFVHPHDIYFPMAVRSGTSLFLVGHDMENVNPETGYYQETITLIDISSPASLTQRGEFKFATHYLTLPGDRHITTIGVLGEKVIASFTEVQPDSSIICKLKVIDFSSPAIPYEAKSYPDLQLPSRILFTAGDSLYTSKGIINASDFDSIKYYRYPGDREYDAIDSRFAVQMTKFNGSNPLTIDDDSTLILLYSMNAGIPAEVRSQTVTANQMRQVIAWDDSTIILSGLAGSQADGYHGCLTIIDASSLDSPQILYQGKLKSTTAPSMTTVGKHLFLHAKSTVALDMTHPSEPMEVGKYVPEQGVYVGGMASTSKYFICTENNKLMTIEVNSGFTGVEDSDLLSAPKSFQIHRFYPNPFNGHLSIEIKCGRSTNLTMKLFNILGQSVFTEHYESTKRGSATLGFVAPSNLPSGIYFLRLQAQTGETITKRITLLR